MMKKQILSTLLFCATTIGFAQNVTFNDANFKNALLADTSINTDADLTEISIAEAQAVTGTIDVNSLSISDLTGIEEFINITGLNCAGNTLTSIDISKNTKLTILHVAYNSISTLNTISNIDLEYLYVGNNSLTNIDINHLDLLSLSCDENSLTTLDVSNNTNLTYLSFKANQLTDINLVNNTAIEELHFSGNSFVNLDLSHLSSLKKVYCSNNQLKSLNLANGYNNDITRIWAGGNPDCCIQIDSGFTPGTVWDKDNTASYSTTPCPEYVNIPDANLKYFLLFYADSNNDDEITVTEAQAFTSALDMNNQTNIQFGNTSKIITDVTGLEAFINITELDLGYHNISNIDLSYHPELILLNLDNNSLTTLDISNQLKLETLTVVSTNIASLDVTNNTALVELNCNNSQQFTVLDVTNNIALKSLNLNSCNSITNLDITKNTVLEYLDMRGTTLDNIDFTKNTVLEILFMNNSAIRTSVDVSKNIALKQLRLNNNTALTSLDLSNNTNLLVYQGYDNTSLTSLNLKNGNNSNMTDTNTIAEFLVYEPVFVTGNTSLTCIEVDNVADANANTAWLKDAAANYSTNCSNLSTNYIASTDYNVYPNPVATTLNVSSSLNIQKVEIYTLLGTKVLTATTTTINVEKLNSGMYLLKLYSTDGKTATTKFIKQ